MGVPPKCVQAVQIVQDKEHQLADRYFHSSAIPCRQTFTLLNNGAESARAFLREPEPHSPGGTPGLHRQRPANLLWADSLSRRERFISYAEHTCLNPTTSVQSPPHTANRPGHLSIRLSPDSCEHIPISRNRNRQNAKHDRKNPFAKKEIRDHAVATDAREIPSRP